MIKKFVKHGNSYALIIDKPIMDLLRITPDTPLEIRTDGRGFYAETAVVADENEIDEDEFQQILEDINTRFSDVFKRLAQ